MVRGYQNKQMKADDTTELPLTPYFFPSHSITIHASSKNEALDKLDEYLKNLSVITNK